MKPHVLLLALGISTAHARLGENEAQCKARYGAPDESLINAKAPPVMPGAKELAYRTGDWRVRVSFAAGIAVRLEYMKAKDAAGTQKVTDDEVQTILEAEKDGKVWHAQVMSANRRRVVRKEAEANEWERSDHATATRKNAKVIISARNSDDIAARLEKLAPAPKPAPGQPAPAKKPKF